MVQNLSRGNAVKGYGLDIQQAETYRLSMGESVDELEICGGSDFSPDR